MWRKGLQSLSLLKAGATLNQYWMRIVICGTYRNIEINQWAFKCFCHKRHSHDKASHKKKQKRGEIGRVSPTSSPFIRLNMTPSSKFYAYLLEKDNSVCNWKWILFSITKSITIGGAISTTLSISNDEDPPSGLCADGRPGLVYIFYIFLIKKGVDICYKHRLQFTMCRKI